MELPDRNTPGNGAGDAPVAVPVAHAVVYGDAPPAPPTYRWRFAIPAALAAVSVVESALALAEPLFTRAPLADVVYDYYFDRVTLNGGDSVPYASCGDIEGAEYCGTMLAIAVFYGAFLVLATALSAVTLAALACYVLRVTSTRFVEQDTLHYGTRALGVAAALQAASFLLVPPTFPYNELCDYGSGGSANAGHCEWGPALGRCQGAFFGALFAAVFTGRQGWVLNACLCGPRVEATASGHVQVALPKEEHSACGTLCMWLKRLALVGCVAVLSLGGLLLVTLIYIFAFPADVDWDTEHALAEMTCPSGGVGFFAEPEAAAAGAECAWDTPFSLDSVDAGDDDEWLSCCTPAGCSGRKRYTDLWPDASARCVDFLSSLDDAVCHFEAGGFVDAGFNVTAGGDQPLHLCDFFTEDVFAACAASSGSALTSAEEWARAELGVGESRNTYFSQDCFSAAPLAGLSVAAGVVVLVLAGGLL